MKFAEKPYWRQEYAESISCLLQKIPEYFERLKKFAQDHRNEPFVNSCVKLCRGIYLNECTRNKNTGTLSEEELHFLIADNCNSEKTQKKMRNLWIAIDYMFGSALHVETLKHELNTNLVKELHTIIGNELISNPGCYRTKPAKPASILVEYLPPHLIEEHMEQLFEDVKQELMSPTQNWYDFAASFFVRFLFIHPFSNGNGRTARLLLSAILIKHTAIPVSFFLAFNRMKYSEVYLQCMVEAHRHNNLSFITSLIIESVHNTLHNCITYLDIDKI